MGDIDEEKYEQNFYEDFKINTEYTTELYYISNNNNNNSQRNNEIIKQTNKDNFNRSNKPDDGINPSSKVNEKELNSITNQKDNDDNSYQKEKILGRKKKNSHVIGNHNKYSEDNIIRKIKGLLLSCILKFINNYIVKIYSGKIGRGIFEKKLKKINPHQILDSKGDKDFLNKNIKDIFSDNISAKYSCYSLNHNKNVIETLLNEENFEIRKKFEVLFSFTFSYLLNYIIGNITIPELEGLDKLDEICYKFEDDKEYLNLIRYYILNFENIIMRKKNRTKNNKYH